MATISSPAGAPQGKGSVWIEDPYHFDLWAEQPSSNTTLARARHKKYQSQLVLETPTASYYSISF